MEPVNLKETRGVEEIKIVYEKTDIRPKKSVRYLGIIISYGGRYDEYLKVAVLRVE